MDDIKLGDKVRCKITGFIGTAVAKTEFINGCTQYMVVPKCGKDKTKILDEMSIDQQSLELVNKPKKKVVKKSTGGPMIKGMIRRNF